MKYLLTIFLCTAASFAASYIEFEKSVIKNAPTIRVYRLEKSASKLKERITLRYTNPTIETEINSFNSDIAKDERGYKVTISQELRTFGFEDDLKEYANTLELLSKKSYEKNRAKFIADLRCYFTKYVKAVQIKKLLNEEIKLVRRLETIAKTGFENGATTRAKFMQASLQRIAAETKMIEADREIKARYYDLMSIAGVKERCFTRSQIYLPCKYCYCK